MLMSLNMDIEPLLGLESYGYVLLLYWSVILIHKCVSYLLTDDTKCVIACTNSCRVQEQAEVIVFEVSLGLSLVHFIL